MAEDAQGGSKKTDTPNLTDTGSVSESADTPSSVDIGDSKKGPSGLADVTFCDKLKRFFSIHWRGVVALLTPLVCIFVLYPFPPEKYQWCAYCLLIMAVYWVTECIPLQVTSFLPVVIFPLTGVMNTRTTCLCYVDVLSAGLLPQSVCRLFLNLLVSLETMGSVLMFIGSIMLACAVEQSGFHKRLALFSIKLIGYSHYRLLFAVCFITMFISMWITNTAATTLMVPIVFAILKVYEKQGLLEIYEKTLTGEEAATKLTSCYFCAITFAATIGGIGTLVGTATNLVFKGLFTTAYPAAPEYLSFPLFSAFAVPYMLLMNMAMYVYLLIVYMGLGRPKSDSARHVYITEEGMEAAKKAVESDYKALGSMNMHEWMVVFLFGGAIILFFARSPEIFTGWGDAITNAYQLNQKKFIDDSTAAMLVVFLMILLPSSTKIFKNFSAKTYGELPKGSVTSVIDWHEMNNSLPYSFSFLLGGGFALSTAAKREYSDLNGRIGVALSSLANLENSVVLLILIVFTVFVTNFASNVAVCNVITPIAMEMARKINQNPLWYSISTGFSASYCFMLPVGTPGNLVVQSAAKIPTGHMIVAGAGPTVTTIVISWLCLYFYAPVIWPDLRTMPSWTI